LRMIVPAQSAQNCQEPRTEHGCLEDLGYSYFAH
jgi:hypothetical protein